MGAREVEFDPAQHLHFRHRERQPFHSNAMALSAWDAEAPCWRGGSIIRSAAALCWARRRPGAMPPPETPVPWPFASGADLLAMGEASRLAIPEMMLANELALRPLAEVEAGLDAIADTMAACIDRGIAQEGTLPGGLKVRRRAKALAAELAGRPARWPIRWRCWTGSTCGPWR
jgi:L-serine dehydratase